MNVQMMKMMTKEEFKNYPAIIPIDIVGEKESRLGSEMPLWLALRNACYHHIEFIYINLNKYGIIQGQYKGTEHQKMLYANMKADEMLEDVWNNKSKYDIK